MGNRCPVGQRLLCFQVGRFFGEVDGSVMASLIKMGMYRK